LTTLEMSPGFSHLLLDLIALLLTSALDGIDQVT
jgi:hypothetical protein